jgi:type II secretion system protein G
MEVFQVMAIRKRLSGQKGFTLIELLVVVAILGILATVAVPRVMDAIDNARAKKAIADMTVIRDGLERFYLDYGVFPCSLDYLVSGGYIDPNFTFKNSYGHVYLYMVQWEGATDPLSLKDYNLGDPGKVPDEVAGTPPTRNLPWVNTRAAFPEGLYDATNHYADFWNDATLPTSGAVALALTKNTDGSALDMHGTLTPFMSALIDAANIEPVPTVVKFTYTGK